MFDEAVSRQPEYTVELDTQRDEQKVKKKKNNNNPKKRRRTVATSSVTAAASSSSVLHHQRRKHDMRLLKRAEELHTATQTQYQFKCAQCHTHSNCVEVLRRQHTQLENLCGPDHFGIVMPLLWHRILKERVAATLICANCLHLPQSNKHRDVAYAISYEATKDMRERLFQLNSVIDPLPLDLL
jgi:hypothetical protein